NDRRRSPLEPQPLAPGGNEGRSLIQLAEDIADVAHADRDRKSPKHRGIVERVPGINEPRIPPAEPQTPLRAEEPSRHRELVESADPTIEVNGGSSDRHASPS